MTEAIDLRPSKTAHVRQRLDAAGEGFRHNLAVLGSAGTGKTWLVREALRSCDARFLKIYCPLQQTSVHGFVRQFAAAVLRGVVGDDEAASPDVLLGRATAVAPKTAEAVDALKRYSAGQFHTEALVHALDLIPIVHRELGRPCVLVFDEFLNLGELGVTQTFHELGKRVVIWPYTTFVLTSSSPVLARTILRERLQLLFGQFELLTLGMVDEEPALAWMERTLPGGQTQAELRRFVLQWTGESARALRALVLRMRERVLLDGPRLPEDSMLLRAAWDVLGSPDGLLHQDYAGRLDALSRVRHGPLAREALLALARGARTTQALGQACQARRHLSHALQVLQEHDLVMRKGACWVIPDQLLGFWLAVVCEPPHGRGLVPQRVLAEAFERALTILWTTWRHSTQLSLAERIEHLLKQFQNEMVCLDHKTGRLPPFRRMLATRPSPTPETYILADGDDQRWCCLVHEGKLEETAIAAFHRFCQTQSPKPSRKIVVANHGLDLNAKLLAKEANMWVWEPEDVHLLGLLYRPPAFPSL